MQDDSPQHFGKNLLAGTVEELRSMLNMYAKPGHVHGPYGSWLTHDMANNLLQALDILEDSDAFNTLIGMYRIIASILVDEDNVPLSKLDQQMLIVYMLADQGVRPKDGQVIADGALRNLIGAHIMFNYASRMGR